MPFQVAARMDGALMRDQIAEWLIRTGGRWRKADVFGSGNRRVEYPAVRPVRCGAPS
jgi:hypothetical protein